MMREWSKQEFEEGVCSSIGTHQTGPHEIRKCCECDAGIPWHLPRYLIYQCMVCGHEMHRECAATATCVSGIPPAYVCQWCEPPPDTETDDEDEYNEDDVHDETHRSK